MQELSVAGAALKRWIYSNITVSITADCSIRVYRSIWESTANSSSLYHTRTKSLLSNLSAFKMSLDNYNKKLEIQNRLFHLQTAENKQGGESKHIHNYTEFGIPNYCIVRA